MLEFGLLRADGLRRSGLTGRHATQRQARKFITGDGAPMQGAVTGIPWQMSLRTQSLFSCMPSSPSSRSPPTSPFPTHLDDVQDGDVLGLVKALGTRGRGHHEVLGLWVSREGRWEWTPGNLAIPHPLQPRCPFCSHQLAKRAADVPSSAAIRRSSLQFIPKPPSRSMPGVAGA